VHTLISPIIFYKVCFVATSRHPKPLLLENHFYIIALTPNLQRVSFYNIIVFFYYSFTTELILSLILLKESYPSSKVLLLCRKSLLALWYCGGQIQVMFATRISTSADNFGLVRNNPARYLRCNFIYEALGIKAKCGWVYCSAWHATSSLVMTLIPGVLVQAQKS
jgi:hypothetical protein